MTRRVRGCRVTAAAALCAAGVFIAACGGGQPDESAAPPPEAPTVNPVNPETAGSISGRVTFIGTPPAPAVLRMDADPNCVKAGGSTSEQIVLVGEGGALQNVFVYVRDGLGDLRFPISSETVVLDQDGCRYVPRVLGVQTGQSVEILNSDPTLHNVHAIPDANQEFNVGQPLEGMKHTHRFSASEVMVPFRCDVHPWMRAYVGVVDHPFFAVTGADGAFTLEGLPPGTYTIEAWHETLGTQTQTVTIAEQEQGEVAFSFGS